MGGGSGKSYGIVQLCVYRCIAERGHRFLVVRKVARTIRQSIYQTIKEVIYSMGCQSLFTFKESDLTIKCVNGNEFIFSGLDDIEKLKSIQSVTDIIGEEFSEMTVSDFRQLDIRLRTDGKYPLQYFIMFNPISINHWLKTEFFDNKKDNATVIETTYKDNKFLKEEAIKVLEDFKTTDEYYYNVYCLGNWGITGKTIFPAKLVQDRYTYLKELYKINTPTKGYFIYNKIALKKENGQPFITIDKKSIKFINDETSYITIYKEPIPYMPYVIGLDTSGGNGTDNDYHCGQVISNIDGEQVAILHNNTLSEDEMAEQIYCLGIYYNTALISAEINFSTYPQKHLEEINYPKLYLREQNDTIGEVIQDKYGFRTDRNTRPALIGNLVKFVKDNIKKINDLTTLDEMLSFVRTEQGRAEAAEGSHDDSTMSLGISVMPSVRNQQSYLPMIEEKELTIFDKLPRELISDEDINEEEENIWN